MLLIYLLLSLGFVQQNLALDAEDSATTLEPLSTTPADVELAVEVEDDTDRDPNNPYCNPTLCEFFNGTDVLQMEHIACHNNGRFNENKCGQNPHLLYMSERRRNFILDMHNLVRSRVALGLVEGYKPAARMPLLKWDDELENLATLHVKRCQFTHDQCRNTPRYPYSGQNIGYYWIGREFKSHTKRMKSFILNWYREYRDANQTFIDSYHFHPEGKKIGHFTMMVADRAHRIGCAAIRFQDPEQMSDYKFLMTCNYDFTNIIGETIYKTGATASKCPTKVSEKYSALCDWTEASYEYGSDESAETQPEEDSNLLDNDVIPFS